MGIGGSFGFVCGFIGLAIFPPERCEVHGEWLKRERATIHYAHMAMTLDYARRQERAKRKLFPHTGDLKRQAYAYGREEQGLNFEWVRYCRKCREAKHKWHSALK